MSFDVRVVVPTQDAEHPFKTLLYVPVANAPGDLFPRDEEHWGFYRTMTNHGYPWRVMTTLHYLRQKVDKFYANPRNRLLFRENSPPDPEFYSLPPATIVTVDMWDSS